MLVLSRKQDEAIFIDTPAGVVQVWICDIRDDAEGRRVKLGIIAPRHIAVHRKEVYEAIQRDKE